MWFFSICVLNIIQIHNISYFLEKSINPGWCSDGLFFSGWCELNYTWLCNVERFSFFNSENYSGKMQTSAEVVLKSHSLCSIIILNTWHTIVEFKRFNCNACTKPQEGRNAPFRVYNMHLNVTLNNITTSRAVMLLAWYSAK